MIITPRNFAKRQCKLQWLTPSSMRTSAHQSRHPPRRAPVRTPPGEQEGCVSGAHSRGGLRPESDNRISKNSGQVSSWTRGSGKIVFTPSCAAPRSFHRTLWGCAYVCLRATGSGSPPPVLLPPTPFGLPSSWSPFHLAPPPFAPPFIWSSSSSRPYEDFRVLGAGPPHPPTPPAATWARGPRRPTRTPPPEHPISRA